MKIDILTIFPEFFESPFSYGNVKIAREKGLLQIKIWDIRDFTDDKHRKVDDYPYGGGAGMILKPEPIFKAVRTLRNKNSMVILLSPQGDLYTQKLTKELSKQKHLLFICSRYKGIDQRVREKLIDREISIGDYILSGGELAAAAIIESVVRLIPSVIGNIESALTDSFSTGGTGFQPVKKHSQDGCATAEENGLLDAPYYTSPREFEGMKVPEILLSGNHKKIAEWRESQRKERTAAFRIKRKMVE